jgi:hypothetical protein
VRHAASQEFLQFVFSEACGQLHPADFNPVG